MFKFIISNPTYLSNLIIVVGKHKVMKFIRLRLLFDKKEMATVCLLLYYIDNNNG